MPGKGLTAQRVRRLRLALTTTSVIAVSVLVGAGFVGTELATASSPRIDAVQTLHSAPTAQSARKPYIVHQRMVRALDSVRRAGAGVSDVPGRRTGDVFTGT